MTFADALADSKGPRPITRTTSEGYAMFGYLDGSVDVRKDHRVVKKLPRGTGPALGCTDWQPEEGR